MSRLKFRVNLTVFIEKMLYDEHIVPICMSLSSSKLFPCAIVTISHCLRYYSTPKKVLNLWIKHNKSTSAKIPIKNCIGIDDLADKVKQKFDTYCQVVVF
ncbi:hypothetical protein BDEG_26909 [Batrachochytrium dendrobatidis JEL423]|uniref:Uncharacterized protein n=1 Tax=Batrachochytrium dendrobatidis (strain JEL423) TaxID=403673 RepID=A0A177WTW8_BATDL|nr:hypothetical protein BDEG_26909 [Batrachochytrium dendrobatidis JEL423]